ncbi:MAG: hypothetical protein WBJ62_05565 [Coriobacteriia bacterium]
MDDEKYKRSVKLLCPTCGEDQFSFEDESDVAPVTCVNCGRQMSRDDLIRENSELVEHNVAEMTQEVVADFSKALNKSLRAAFKGNKNIRFK